jgi:hypothetical protein
MNCLASPQNLSRHCMPATFEMDRVHFNLSFLFWSSFWPTSWPCDNVSLLHVPNLRLRNLCCMSTIPCLAAEGNVTLERVPTRTWLRALWNVQYFYETCDTSMQPAILLWNVPYFYATCNTSIQRAILLCSVQYFFETCNTSMKRAIFFETCNTSMNRAKRLCNVHLEKILKLPRS